MLASWEKSPDTDFDSSNNRGIGRKMESKDEGANKIATVSAWKLADYNTITHILKTRKHKKASQNPTTLPRDKN